MGLKLNIRPEVEEEMERLLPIASVRSKTEYINQAIREYNAKLKRQAELDKLKRYFQHYYEEGRTLLSEFANLRTHPD